MKKRKNTGLINWDTAFANFSVSFAVLLGASALCALVRQEDHSGSTAAIMIFVLAVLVIARITQGYIWGIAASVIGVVVVNFIFTYPFFELNFSLTGYPLIFATMLVVSIITSATSTQLKRQEELRIENEKEAIRSNLLRAISHDIRTPLTSIVGSTSALMDEQSNLNDKQKECLLQDVHDDAEWLIRVTENILSITRMGGDSTILKTPELAEELIETSIRKFAKRHPDAVPVNVSLPLEPLIVPMDIILIEQVLSNLLENALIHGTGLSKIDVRLEATDTEAIFSIENDGVAIPENAFPTLFSGILRQDNDAINGDKRCMGIGLAVCKTVIEAHGGSISARNITRESGVVFSFSLPL